MLGNWKLIPLAEMASFSRGVSWRKEEESKNGEGIAVLSIPNIGRGQLNFDAKHRLKKLPNTSKLLAVGDVLFVGSSGSIDNIARNARVTMLPTEPVAFASFTFKATPRQAICDPAFFYFLMNSALPAFTDFARRAADGKFNFQLTSFVERSSFRIPLLDEQQHIAAVLSAVQRAIERQERLIALTAELKKAFLHKVFTEGTRGESLKQTEIGSIPASWKLKTVQELVDDRLIGKPLDGNHGSIHPKQSEYVDAGIPFVMASDLADGSIDLKRCNFITKARADRLQKGFAREGDVLISHKATIGVTAIVPPVEHYVMLTPQVTYYRVLDEARLNNRYLRAYFDSHRFQERFTMVADDGSTRAYIGITKQRQLPILLPELDEQRAIADCVHTLERKMVLAKQHRLILAKLFRTSLHQLMTAEIRVHDLDLSALEEAEREPAGAA